MVRGQVLFFAFPPCYAKGKTPSPDLANDDDRKAICASLQAAIERHEPRLRDVSATLDAGDDASKSLNFFISATLRVHAAVEPVNFNALLQPSTRHYSISQIRRAPRPG
jgi:type VI secretion system protein ImpF